MKKLTFKILVLMSSSLISNISFAQNLVPNPSFEDYTSCPNGSGQVNKATGWDSYNSSPEYFHYCSTVVSVPDNWGFGYQCSATGNAHCGFIAYNPWSPNNRELIGRQLSNALIPGEIYYVNMKVSLGEWSNCATNKLGILFSTIPYDGPSSPPINNSSHIYASAIITDTINWLTITGSFIADSAYEYIIIGNFFDDANTDTSINDNSNLCKSYYFVDDVCVSMDSLTCVDIKEELINFNTDTTVIKKGDCINFILNTVVNYDFYEWQFESATPTTSSDSMPVNICYDSSGVYSVTLIAFNSNGCRDTINKTNYIIVQEGTGMVAIEDYENEIEIYPNPVNNMLYIDLKDNEKIMSVKIYDILGNLAYYLSLFDDNGNLYSFDLSGIAIGIYYIQIKTFNQNNIIKKISIIR